MIADYKTGQTSSLDLLLSASDFGEFMAGMEYIQRIAKHDKELTDTLEQQVNEIQGSKQERETKLSSLQTQKSDMETKLTEAQNERDEITAIRANKQAKQDELNSDKQKSIKHSNEVQQQIQETREELEDATQAILAVSYTHLSSVKSSIHNCYWVTDGENGITQGKGVQRE